MHSDSPLVYGGDNYFNGQVAEAKLDVHGRVEAQKVASLATTKCPLSLDDLCTKSYDVRTLLQKIPSPQTPAAA